MRDFEYYVYLQMICIYDSIIYVMKDKIFNEELKKILKDNNYKVTQQRLSVLKVFFDNEKPINVDYIYKTILKKINITTIYRILISFEHNNIIRKVNLRKDAIYFELNNDHHHHLVCLNCGTIEDFEENTGIAKLLDEVVDKSIKFNKIKEHSLELFGFCKECN